jgi:hypothetical protein
MGTFYGAALAIGLANESDLEAMFGHEGWDTEECIEHAMDLLASMFADGLDSGLCPQISEYATYCTLIAHFAPVAESALTTRMRELFRVMTVGVLCRLIVVGYPYEDADDELFVLRRED